MAQYLVLLRKQDFADLYKYGIFHANRDCIIEFAGDIQHVSENYNYFESLTAFSNSFDSTFTYFVLHYNKTKSNNRIADIEIEDVQGIYPLDSDAKILLEEDFGPTIKFSEPLWKDAVLKLRIKQAMTNSIKGLSNVIHCFHLEDKYVEKCNSIFDNSIMKEVLSEVFADKRPEGELPYWVYLLRYERHSMYPNTTLGFCMDAVHALTNFSQKREFSSIDGAGIYQFMDNMDYTMNMSAIMNTLNNATEAERFISYIKTVDSENNILLISSIYFILKNKFKDGLYYDEKFVENSKKYWPFEFTAACYLLGWVLGHTRSFECLYEQISLKIRRKRITRESEHIYETATNDNRTNRTNILNSEALIPDAKTAPSNLDTPKAGDQLELFKGEDALPALKIRMGKLKKKPKNNKDVCTRPAPVIVTSKAEMERLLKDKWVIID